MDLTQPMTMYNRNSVTTKFNVKLGTAQTSAQTVDFTDRTPGYLYEVVSQPDPSFRTADTWDATLGEFMSRPVKVASYDWPYNTVFQQVFNPWSLFFENPKVINRIANFNLLRCKLNVKLTVNGNGFHYGRVIASYLPLHLQDNLTVDRAHVQQDLIAASQRPHVYLDPTQSMGGQLKLPFFYYKDALSIPLEEWDQMGEVNISTMNTLQHANGGTDKVTISVFVWAEDLELSVPTSALPPSMTPQSGRLISPPEGAKAMRWRPFSKTTQKIHALLREKPIFCRPGDVYLDTYAMSERLDLPVEQFIENPLDLRRETRETRVFRPQSDEYGDGPISTPATTIAAIAESVSNIPIIGPYARATAMVASGVGAFARLFGYSKPAVIDTVKPFRNLPAGYLSNTNVDDGVEKLALDVKQELCIDPRVVGLSNVDEMAIKSLVTRESYLNSFNWTNANTPETLLWTCQVSPVLFDFTNDEVHTTPMAYVSNLFDFWRGTIKYRFQIVGSTFHKGRLKIVYDPHQSGAVSDYNVNYVKVIDIAQDNDFTIEVGWGSSYGWLGLTFMNTLVRPFNTTPLLAIPEHNNGVISVYVVNELTSPGDDDPINVNVFVSGGDDLEFGSPANKIDEYSFFPHDGDVFSPESGEGADAENLEESSIPIQTTVSHSIASTNLPDSTAVYMGEECVSLRSLIKRYDALYGVNPVSTNGRIMNQTLPSYPPYKGAAPGAIHVDSSAVAVNYVRMTLVNYILPMYGAVRGGMRYKMLEMGAVEKPSTTLVTRESTSFTGAKYNRFEVAIPSSTNQEYALNQHLESIVNGCAYNKSNTNSVTAVEVPYYNNYRFTPAKRMDVNVSGNPFTRAVTFKTWVHTTTNVASFAMCVAGAEDLSCYFFLGCPILYFHPVLPPQ